MIAFAAWVLVIVGLVSTHRAARRLAGGGAATLAAGALLLGQLLTFPLAVADAAIFAVAAIAIERALALAAAGRRGALALLLIPALSPVALGVGVPTIAKLTDVLFCSQHGVAATSAVLWFGFAGALLDRRIAATLAAIALTAAGAFHESWTWQESVRLFDAAVPIAGIGLALLSARLRDLAARRPGWAVATLLAPFLLFNMTLAAVAAAGGFRVGEPFSFGAIGSQQARVGHEWFGHPFSFPATLWFRATTGLPAAQFDLQGVSHLDAAHPIALDIGDLRVDAPWLGEGWHGDERAGDLTFRWTNVDAVVFLPPLPAARVAIRILVRPIPVASAPPQTMHVRLGRHDLGTVTLGEDWTWVERELDLRAGGARASRLTLTFDHAVRPSIVDPRSGDTRDLAAAIDRIDVVIR